VTENRRAKIAVVGVGIMGSNHLRSIHDLGNTDLVAVCDIDRDRADKRAAQHDTVAYYDHRDLLDHDGLDGIIVSTPHYDHTPIAIDALSRDIHVLVEKPIAVHAKDAHKMIKAYEAAKAKNPELVFAAMFNQRTYGFWQKMRSMIQVGELGKLVRATWVITNWFRPQIYYDNGGWRATWKGEGGGVLLNQCPHNLDLYQWFVGMPTRVTGFASIGKYHRIEVEDEVTAYLEHENGMVGHFERQLPVLKEQFSQIRDNFHAVLSEIYIEAITNLDLLRFRMLELFVLTSRMYRAVWNSAASPAFDRSATPHVLCYPYAR